MAQCFAIEDMIPVIDPSAYVHPTAVLIGDVIVGPGCYVGPAACLRGDFGRITLREGSNVQDTCVMHGFPDGETLIDVNGHIGHGAVIHGAHIGVDALVGINAVVMDNAKVGEGAVIGAMAYVSEGMVIPPRSLAIGIPARVVRELSDKELAWKRGGTLEYQQLVERSRASQRPVEPLREPQADRPHYSGGISKTLKTVRG
ncbi:MAG: transferase hexapeptide repeat family protein [Rhodobiaceae bacterium]|nr:transferase hexapeptide repeat family protein [Rhodobiaceae bacterium]MCC0014770.1 transferase hexapeptide repeat family protein [Rhodobiaceae bacterium]MCC0041376.1 transferase hexapeptide repeat family protein [Rhodobiaceae bacterium]MCC0054275.1 transferase hexapeptide repeat family protein [Rhodobiaceae bacterium]